MIQSLFNTEEDPPESENKFDGEMSEKKEAESPESDIQIAENVVSETETTDDLDELEKAVAKIEDEIKTKSQAKAEDENLIETDVGVQKEKLKKNQPGIFTLALNKSVQNKERLNDEQSFAPAEESPYAPNEIPTVSALSEDETQSFILPNNIESTINDTFLGQTGEMSQLRYKPESKTETIRKSGLAFSAGIAFFGSVIFLLILGWFADLLLGTSPWGAVGGILLGSIIGFTQLFRLTSQILKNND